MSHLNITSTRAIPDSLPFHQTFAAKAVIAVVASLFVAACAQTSVPLPFTPVPLTLSDFAVLLVGLSLGPTMGFAALVLYLLEGATGLPVFAHPGPGGLAQLFAWPSSGFLLSYPFAAALAGALSRKLRPAFKSAFTPRLIAAAAASVLLMTAGVVYLGFFLHLTPVAALSKGTIPFLPGQCIKVVCAAGLATSFNRMRKR